jgi:secondary thiamine-phosphate synthase enzyme
MWKQSEFVLSEKPRGFHLVTNEVLKNLPEIEDVKVGLLHLFIKHTSASLSINENADPDVRVDLESHFNHAVPENQSYYKHLDEGPDDTVSHIKSSIIGASLMLPINAGRLNLGIWQGLYLCEHRNYGGRRKLVATIQGE